MSELHSIDKPREKLAKKGVSALENFELLAVLLGSGTKDKDVLKLSREIIRLFDDGFEKISLEKLVSIHGLGIAKASQILSAVELQEYKMKKQEYFIVITLDGANHIINNRVVFIGTLNRSLVHPREVFADALTDRAAAIIVAHNHPSGVLEASREDMAITQRLKEASKILGINLLDHIIFTNDGYFSFADEKIL